MSHMTFQFIYLRQMLRHDTTFQFNFFEANVEKNVATSIPMASVTGLASRARGEWVGGGELGHDGREIRLGFCVTERLHTPVEVQ